MSTEKHPIDQLFQDKLGQYSLDAPDHIWKNIESRRTPLYKAINYFKNKRGAMAGVLALLIVAAGVTVYMGTGTEQAPAQQMVYAPSAANPVAVAQPENNSQPAADIQTEAGQIHAVSAVQNTNTPRTNNPTGVNATHANTPAAVEPQANNPVEKQENTAAEVTGNKEAKETTPAKPATNNENLSASADDKTIQENILLTEGDKGEITAMADNADAADKTDAPEKADAAQGQQKTTKKPEYMLGKWGVDIYASADMAGRSLSANNAMAAYATEKDRAESFRPGFTTGARVHYTVNNFLKLRAGIQYTRLNERLNFNHAYTTTRIDTVTGVVLDPVTQQPIGTVTRIDTTQTTTQATARANNSYTFIDIPLQAEWHVYTTPKLSLFVSAGAMVNLRFTQHGRQLRYDLTGASELNSNNPYKTNAGISLLGGIGAEYALCNRFSVLAEAGYRQGLNSVLKNTSGMNQTFRVFTAGAGIRYKF